MTSCVTHAISKQLSTLFKMVKTSGKLLLGHDRVLINAVFWNIGLPTSRLVELSSAPNAVGYVTLAPDSFI